jgi:hypothetical protein
LCRKTASDVVPFSNFSAHIVKYSLRGGWFCDPPMADSVRKEAYAMPKLNRREQTKINYMKNGGNMKKAMIDAGYSETYADKNARYLMGIIGEEIKEAQEELKVEGIKSVEEVQRWWSSLVDDENLDMNTRIKVSEDIVRSQGGFIDRLKGDVNISKKLEDLL